MNIALRILSIRSAEEGKGGWVTLGVIAAVLALAVVLNPSPEKHRESIKESVSRSKPLAAMLGVGKLTAFASGYHSVGVGSYIELNHQLVSVGALGVVLVVQ